MFKLPLMITVLQAAERNPTILSDKVIYDINPISREDRAELDAPTIEIGKPYTVAELVQQMIIYSDNDAKTMLQQVVSANAQKEVFQDLGLEMPAATDLGDTLSPRSFSLFFRVLYNGSYLSHENSETALALLSKTKFKDGIVAGVPANIIVAHKYGHRVILVANGENNEQLHDCGIIYRPRHPYLLCITTKGQDYQSLVDVIQHISQTVYNAVDSDYH